MIFDIWKFRKIALPFGFTLALLTGCGAQEQDAFEIAKAHVWGDKINGCDYHTMTFSNNAMVRNNSQEMIDKIGFFDKSMVIPKVENLLLSKVKKDGERFTVFVDKRKTVFTFQISDGELQWYSTDEQGLIKIDRGGKAIPTDFVACS